MRHPWLVKAMGRFDPARHPRGQPENAGEFTSAGGGASAKPAAPASPGSRHNPDLDAAMGMGAAKAPAKAPPPTGDPFADYQPGTQDVRQFPRGATKPAAPLPTARHALPALPHMQTQNAALQAVRQLQANPGSPHWHKLAAHTLDAHLKAGLAELHRRAAHAGPRAGNMYRKAAEAFRAKMSAARAKVDALAGRGPPPVPRRPGQGPPPLADRGKVRPFVSMKGLRHPWLVTKAVHDVSGEKRDESGKWTGGGASMPHGLHTREGADAIVSALRERLPGARAHVVGSVARKGRSKNDIDIFAAGGLSEPAAAEKVMGDLGFKLTGQSVVSPKEAKKSRKMFHRGFSEILHFQSGSGHRVELWHPVEETKALRYPSLVTKAAPLALDLAVPHPWLAKSRDATGHEHAADGRFGTGAGHGKAGQTGRTKPGRIAVGRTAARTADPDAKARTLVAKIKAVPAAVRQKVTAFVTGRYQKLSARYGRNGARAILGATILLLPAPVPGSSLIPVAFAEVALRLRRAVMKGGPLDAKTIQAEARALLADLMEHMKGTDQ